MEADYRVRTQIRDSLEKKYFQNLSQPFACHIAFQIAFCYQIGFGVKSDNNECQLWLQKANKQLDNLKIEKEAVILESENRGRVHRLNGLMSVDLIDEYRTWGLDQLQDARKEYEREVADMTREFGELHIIPLGLYRTTGNLLDALGEFANSKTLRMQLREKIESTYGIGHPYYIQSLLDVAESHTILGE
jgi:hypothetical protein